MSGDRQAQITAIYDALHDIARARVRVARALRAAVADGWSVAELARMLDVTRGTIYRWMSRGDQ